MKNKIKQGYNVFALSFWLISGPADQALDWTTLSSSTRSSIKSSYTTAGIKLIVSAFGSTDAPTSTGTDPTTTANNLATFVIQYGLDGVDVDYEDFNAMNAMDGSAEAWLATFTTALREKLSAGQYIITHAPAAPWFSPKYTSGGYLKVHQTVGSLIDWYNVQFYNQGSSEYTTCTGLLTASSPTWPKTAVFQLSAAGVTLNKIVIGKPATSTDASNGYMSPSTLANCLGTAVGEGWNAGVMVWQYPDAAASWIQTVRSVAFPE
ncbi:glycoside hydrolase family 18 protein [Gyrodon lividus]|nr:glycoside hydrolase family 18 protein [Gyrodon lividus]